MKLLVLVALIAVCILASSAIAQEPVQPIDIKADGVSYRFLSPSLIEITVTFTVQNSGGGGGGGGGYNVESFFDIFLEVDGTPHRAPLNFSVSDNDCGIDPECDNPCEITVSSGEIKWNYCNIWHTWTGMGCDPYNPGGTCIPLDICACGAQFEIETVVPYEGEPGPIFVVGDPTNLVLEADETNNTCMTLLEPLEPVEPIAGQAA